MQPTSTPTTQTKAVTHDPGEHYRDPWNDDPVFIAYVWVMLVVVGLSAVGYMAYGLIIARVEVQLLVLRYVEAYDRFRNRKLTRVIDEELCRHGLSNSGITRVLLGLDHFSYAMDGKVCTCVKREDGSYDFGFPTPNTMLEIVADDRRLVEVSGIAARGIALAEREARENPPLPADYAAGGSLITVAGGQP